MLKIHKGLKKKKKDKKNKRKEEDLFDEEELEKYRKEHSNAVTATDPDAAQPSNSEHSDEWQKFKALTDGVDTILQKTQEDLDRIKSTSFFQRKAPPTQVEKQKQEEEFRQSAEEEHNVRERKGGDSSDHPSQSQTQQQQQQQAKTDSEEESEEIEVDDTLFDTSYVDAVASGELKLAYIPDSPPDKEDDFDPFDTSYANKFIDANPKKRYLNLGCAVQVLSGRQSTFGDVEKTSCPLFVEKKSPRRRPKPVDLLLTSFDEGVDQASAAAAIVVERTPLDSPAKTLLDEDPLFARDDDIPPLSVTPTPAPAPLASTLAQQTCVDATRKKDDVLDLSDFDVLASDQADVTTANGNSNSLEQLRERASSGSTDDEFAQLAAESLARKLSSALSTPIGGLPPLKPFDAISPTAANLISAHPLQPAAPPIDVDETDPFDTSIVAKVILPGKQEIKLIEKELLGDIVVPSSRAHAKAAADDDDFDPRAGESLPVKVIRPQELLIERRAEAQKIVSPSEKPDILAIEEIDVEVAKPLTPLAATNPENADDYDPFDTSHICGAPGKLELKLIESELTRKYDDDDDDDDFDPRKYEKIGASQRETTSVTRDILTKYSCNSLSLQQQQQEQPTVIDILTGSEEDATAVHVISTPVQPEKYVADSTAEIVYSDPFDTSIADNIQPGKVELKLLETELIN